MKWRDLIHTTSGNSLLRHTEDDTTLLVLRESTGTGLMHLQHPGGAVIPHTGHDDADGILACAVGRRSEQHIH